MHLSLELETSPLSFHSLSFLEEGDEVVIGRADIDSYGVFPHDGAAVLQELRDGRPPADAAAWYEATYRQPVDMEAFLETLRELHFLREDADGNEDADEPRPIRWQRLGRVLFSAPAWVCYALVVAAAVAASVHDPRLVPRLRNVFFSDYLLLVELTVVGGQVALSLLHEGFHVLAGRRLGLASSVRISRRLYFVVFETVLDGLAVVPRRKRYLPILAGMLADVLVVAILTLAAYLSRQDDGSISLVGGVCLALAFTTLPRIVWQFYFFLRTDVYYLVTTMLACVDLETATRGLLRNRLNALLGRHERLLDEEAWHPRDRHVARWYAPLFVAGYGVSIAMLVVVVAPLAWQFLGGAFQKVFLDDALSPAEFWDSVALLLLNGVQLALAAAIAIRDRRRRASQSPEPREPSRPAEPPAPAEQPSPA